jgi:hypothetical protein
MIYNIHIKYLIIVLINFVFSCSNSEYNRPTSFTGQWLGTISFEHEIIEVDIQIEFRDNEVILNSKQFEDSSILTIDSLGNNYVSLSFDSTNLKGNPYKFKYMMLSKLDTINVLYVQCHSSNENMRLWFGHLEKH